VQALWKIGGERERNFIPHYPQVRCGQAGDLVIQTDIFFLPEWIENAWQADN